MYPLSHIEAAYSVPRNVTGNVVVLAATGTNARKARPLHIIICQFQLFYHRKQT